MRISRLLAPALLAALVGFAPHGRVDTQRWALIIGISDYENFGDEVGGDLPGAVNDATGMRDVLVARWGFRDDQIRLLLDGEATRAGIVRALSEWLPAQAKPGDLVLVYFAGHGSQMWDTSGDEPDGLDETICPVDVLKGDTRNDISDDEIGGWLRALPTDNVVVVFDKCFAESSTRAATPFARPRSLARDVTRDVTRPATPAARGSASSESVTDSPGDKVVELAASQDDEVAVDALWPTTGGEEVHGGAFTTLLLRNLWQAPRGTTYEEAFARTADDLRREKFAQRPQLTGAGVTRARPLFWLGGEPAADVAVGLPVMSAAAGSVVLGGGGAAGVTPGSIYRAGNATLRVTGVERDRAHATLVAGTSPAVGSTATLEAFVPDAPVLRVQIADLGSPARSALRNAVGTLAGIRLVDEPGAFAHLIVRPAERGYVVLGLDGAVRHTLPATLPGAAPALARIAAAEAAALRLARLDNPAAGFALDFGMSGGASTFGLGEEIAFRARSERAGYLTIVDLGTDGTVTVIFPNALDGDNRIGAGAELVVPTPAMQAQFVATPPAGRGIVRAFVTEQPLPLGFEQGDAGAAVLLADALRDATGATGGAAIPVAGWATAAVAYEIRE